MDFVNLESVLKHAMPEHELEVPEWGGVFHFRTVTVQQFERARKRSTRSGKLNEGELNAMIICHASPEFEPARYMALLQKEAGVVARVSQYILWKSGYQEFKPEAGETEEGEA